MSKNEVQNNNAGEEQDIQQILSDIKSVITSNDEVLVLTDVVEDEEDVAVEERSGEPDNSQNQQVSADSEMMLPTSASLKAAPDILEEIDSTMSEPLADASVPPLTQAEPVLDSVCSYPANEALAPKREEGEEGLISAQVASSVQSTISAMLDKEKTVQDVRIPQGSLGSQTFEDVIITILKQELQSWLNEHLEETVKAIVEKEIKRILPK